MTSALDAERLAALEKRRNEFAQYLSFFEAAFDELHDAVVTKVRTPNQYVGPHHDYPVMSILQSGFPSFHEFGYYRENSPRDYVGTVRPRGLGGLLGGYYRPGASFPKGDELAAFLRNHDIGKRLDLGEQTDNDTLSNWLVDRLVGDAVERYLHLHGLDAPVAAERRRAVILPLMSGTIRKKLDLRLVVPVTLTHFAVDHFPLTETTYITRLPKKLQLARARMTTLGSGAVRNVFGAATHAFVSNGWSVEVDNVHEVHKSLSQSSSNVLDAIDSFFGSLRIATGISTGYAQIVWVPRRWALNYFCDLTPVYGTTLRQYPGEYDHYGWVRQRATVTAEHLNEIRRIYRAVASSKSEAVRLALKRLNGCLTRSDAADAVLDGTIGLELLLGDDQNQSLSYKLRLRAAALGILQANPDRPASEIAVKVKRLYEARSAIVHGQRKKRSKKASEPADTRHADERLIASDLLRFVLDILLSHPEYQDPAKIDEGLLLRGDEIVLAQKPTGTRRNRRGKRAEG